RRLLKIVAVCLALWLLPLAAAISAFGLQNVSVKLYLFFTQAAFVTFGGAYAVLAYVNQAAVGAGWITAAQAVDGLALAETTPGPLIMVLQFIGFMTGWQSADGVDQILFAVICGLLVTFATFLPSFLLVFSGAPYVERLQDNVRLSAALVFVTAAVVGVILDLSVVFGSAVLIGNGGIDVFAVVVAAAAFCALYFFKIDVLVVVLAGGLVGLGKYLLFG
ncbi:MAG: chromate transporter, partial [Acidobacteriota bacterium]